MVFVVAAVAVTVAVAFFLSSAMPFLFVSRVFVMIIMFRFLSLLCACTRRTKKLIF